MKKENFQVGGGIRDNTLEQALQNGWDIQINKREKPLNLIKI